MSNNNNEIPKRLATAAYKKIIQAPVESFERASKEEIAANRWADINVKLSLGNGVAIMIGDSPRYICVSVCVDGKIIGDPTNYYYKEWGTDRLNHKLALVYAYIREKEEEKLHKNYVYALEVINASMS